MTKKIEYRMTKRRLNISMSLTIQDKLKNSIITALMKESANIFIELTLVIIFTGEFVSVVSNRWKNERRYFSRRHMADLIMIWLSFYLSDCIRFGWYLRNYSGHSRYLKFTHTWENLCDKIWYLNLSSIL